MAERWFLSAAKDGDPSGSIKAQTVLGLFYSRPGEDSFDLEKVSLGHVQQVPCSASQTFTVEPLVMHTLGMKHSAPLMGGIRL